MPDPAERVILIFREGDADGHRCRGEGLSVSEEERR